MEKLCAVIEESLMRKYDFFELNGKVIFILPNNTLIRITHFGKCVVVEYANNMEQAKVNVFEDGDAINVEIYNSDEIISMILNEVENEG